LGVSTSDEEHQFFKASPKGDPAGIAVALATEMAAQAGNRAEEFAGG